MVEIWQAIAIAGMAGFVNYIQRFAGEKASRPVWEWAPCGVRVATGSSAGVVAMWIVPKKLGLEIEHAYFAVWIAGWGGPLFFDFAWKTTSEVAGSFFARAAQRLQDGKGDVEPSQKK